MRIQPPTERERETVRRALLAAADELRIDRTAPLALPLFLARAGLVTRELLDERVRVDRRRHDLTYREIGIAFGISMQSAHSRFREPRS
jgi:hypothetical protein